MFSDQAIQQALMKAGVRDGTNGAVLVGGSGGVTHGVFYMHATLDAEATEKAGRRIYREAPYIKLWAEGSKDQADHIADAADRKEYPQEWAAFEAQRANPTHSVTHLPGFSAVHFRYCDDAEIYTIEDLVQCDVQPELKELQAMGVRWLSLLQPEAVAVKKRGGRKLGSKNKPKVKADGIVAENPA